MRCNSGTTKPYFTYLHYIYQISSIQPLPTSQHPYIQEMRKIDTGFHSIKQETSYTKWEADTA